MGEHRLGISVALSAMTCAIVIILQECGCSVIMKQLSHRVITTRYGKVRGILVEFPNRHLRPVEAYLGLRYADLDNGGMRFMPPKNPMEKWSGIRVAIKNPTVCPQKTKHEKDLSQFLPDGRVTHLRNITPFLRDQDEDCLTLNLYVPIKGKEVLKYIFSPLLFVVFLI